MKNEGYPWTQVGPGPQPQLPADFASRVIEKAQTTRARKRRSKFGVGVTATFAAMLATFLWMRPTPPTPIASTNTLGDYYTTAWSYQPDPDVLTVLMPSARPVEKFDAYYGTAGWDTYASWDGDIYSIQTR